MTIEDELRVEIVETLRKRKKEDIKEIIDCVMATPLKKGEMLKADGITTFSQLMAKDANMDTATRIILAQTARAMNGDVKSAEFLFRYGGYTPAIDQKITLELPQIVDDISAPDTRDILTSAVSKDTIHLPPASNLRIGTQPEPKERPAPKKRGRKPKAVEKDD